jgi:hypothetical protein
VIGETFGAETIAHIQGVEDSQVISQLGGVLEREQRLVTAQGLQRVGPRRLSQYRFRHILFQQYLYNRLSQSQRAYLHRAVAQELEQSYGAETSRIAPQLAHQYVSAGDNARALHYFTVAGNAAAAVYANAEAAAHYRRALDLIETGQDDAQQLPDRRQQFQLYTRLGRVLELSARCDEAIEVYKEMEHAARLHDEQAMVLVALLARAAICTTVNFARDPVVGRTLLNQARNIALALGDRAAEAKILWNLLILSAYTGGDPDERLTYGDEALALARKLELPEQLAFTLHDIFYAYAGTGQWVRARAMLYEARDLWQRLGNLPMLSEAYTRLHWTYLVTGEPPADGTICR